MVIEVEGVVVGSQEVGQQVDVVVVVASEVVEVVVEVDSDRGTLDLQRPSWKWDHSNTPSNQKCFAPLSSLPKSHISTLPFT